MTSFFRRPGAVLATFVKTAADPAAVPNQYLLYSKDDAYGNTQIYGRPDAGAILQLTPGEVIRYAGNPNGALSAAIYSLSVDPATGTRYVNTDGATAWSVWAGGSYVGTPTAIPFVGPAGSLTDAGVKLAWDNTNFALRLGSGLSTVASTELVIGASRFGVAEHAMVMIEAGTARDAGIWLVDDDANLDAAIFLDYSDSKKLKVAMGKIDTDADRQTNTKIWVTQGGEVGIGVTPDAAVLFHVKSTQTAEGVARLENSSTSGYAGLECAGSSGVISASMGYANGAVGIAHLQSLIYIYAVDPVDVVLANATRVQHRFGMTADSAHLQMAAGAAAGVSAAGTMRIKYNEGAGTAQVSFNGGAYVTFVTI